MATEVTKGLLNNKNYGSLFSS